MSGCMLVVMDQSVLNVLSVFSMARPREFDERSALQRAMQVFWRKGFEATSLADLLKATGLSKSGVPDIHRQTDAVSRRPRGVPSGSDEELREQLNDGRPARQSIEVFFGEMLGHAAEKERPYGCMNCNEAVELGPEDAEVRKLVAADFQAVEDLFADAIQRGQDDGSIRNHDGSPALARFLTVNLQGLQVMARARVDARASPTT